ncbi:MAG: relaxase/mobilization nuclease domain-containing protein, partial [Faecalibacterium sp.]
EDVKSHHYIISFDPRDGPDNGLTVDRAQELGEKFCAEHFPGHQALVCTHPDGHNHSGNIHVHIVINSLRIYEVPLLPYMDRPADTREGCKHRCTNAAMEYFKSEVMEMCHREGLYQIDLLNGSKNRVTDREYWAQKKGQAALDKQNAPMIAGGITPRQTKFETNKEKLRQTIRAALSAAASFEDFSSLLLREGVAVKESRGRLSYLTPDRTKPITARKLGDDFDRAAVLAVLEQNAARAAEKAAAIPDEYPRRGKAGIQPTKAPQTAPKQDGVQRLVDIEQKKAEGKGRGYERWATMHNLKQMAATLNVYQEYGFTSPEQLEAAVDTAYQEMRQTSGKLKTLETKLQGKKELQRQVLAYAKTKPARDGLKAQKSEKARAAYRQAHESDFIIAEASARYFKAHGITKLPARKALQAEIEQLISEKDGLYNTYHEQKQRFKELQTVKRNIDQILRREEPHRRKEQSHER